MKNDKSINFGDTGFFSRNPGQSLPSPEQVRNVARINSNYKVPCRSLAVHFLHLRLTVKFGTHVSVAEGHRLREIRRYLLNSVPVPEIYSWQCDRGEVFLYMEHILGKTLEQCWPTLGVESRNAVCEQL
jgi:aminoglycoside phosphotransferase